MIVRKNQANLSAAEKSAFVNAVLELKRRGVYDEFVTLHRTRFIQDMNPAYVRTGHNTPSFLPWHRQYLIAFERELRTIDASVSIPYWNWVIDRSPTASPWTPDLLGGGGLGTNFQVLDGPFAYATGNWPITVQIDTHPFLRRTLGGTYPLPRQSDVDQAMAATVYDAPPWNENSPNTFRNILEGNWGAFLHNQVHTWVGGQMAQPVSPNDPVFWLHHAFVDKLWADWQQLHPASPYLPNGTTPDAVDLNEAMAPWDGPGGVTPAQMLDHTPYYTYL
ncbi:tyrosinase family protein [Streptomyces sp. NPDC057638]|uniref:tyrosinase family protein n=1 Tax=Streptomyces sp. NPDC057638 TaxID=3346190 RepID=UPI0036A6FE16